MYDEILDKFNKQNDVTYVLQAVNGDGEVLASFTSKVSADDVTGFSALLEQKLFELASNDAEDDEDFSEAE